MSEPKIEGAEGIAVVGIAARFPGAANAGELWRNLREGVESITFFGDEELQRQRIDLAHGPAHRDGSLLLAVVEGRLYVLR